MNKVRRHANGDIDILMKTNNFGFVIQFGVSLRNVRWGRAFLRELCTGRRLYTHERLKEGVMK
jgi:hypothetical protein